MSDLREGLSETERIDCSHLNSAHLEFIATADENTALWELQGIRETIRNMQSIPQAKEWFGKITRSRSACMTGAFVAFSPRAFLRAITLSRGKFRQYVERQAKRCEKTLGFEWVHRHRESGLFRIGTKEEKSTYFLNHHF